MPSARTRRRAAGATLAFIIGAGQLLAQTSAHGDPIADKQRQATEIAAKLQQLQRDVESNANRFEAAEQRLADVQSQIGENQQRLDTAKAELEQRRKELSTYAINSYVRGGGSQDGFTSLASGSMQESGARQAYNVVVMGDRQQVADALNAAERDARDRQSALDRSKKDAEQAVATIRQKRAAAEQATAQYKQLNSEVQGELRQLVADKQAADQRAREAQAYQAALAQSATQSNRPPAAAAASPTAAPSSGRTAPPAPPASGGNTPPPIASNGSKGSGAVAAAMTKLGRPYVWGAAGPNAFDCSGLTQWAYQQVGVSIPRVTWDQERAGRVVPVSQIQPGDLVFYDGGGHMAMYTGGGQVIHAPRTGDVVRIASLYMMPVELVVRVA